MYPNVFTQYAVTLLLVLAAAAPATGQRDSATVEKRLEVGVGGGVMLHAVDFTPNASVEDLLGNSYGLRLRYFDNKLVGFQAELSYVQAGWREDLGEDVADLYRREIDYAELLILTQFSVGRGAFQPMLQAGPYLAAPLSERETLPADFDPPDTVPPTYYGRPLDFRVNYGLHVGLGFNLSIGPVTVQADGRYLVGFSDLLRSGATTAVASRRSGVGGRLALFYAL